MFPLRYVQMIDLCSGIEIEIEIHTHAYVHIFDALYHGTLPPPAPPSLLLSTKEFFLSLCHSGRLRGGPCAAYREATVCGAWPRHHGLYL